MTKGGARQCCGFWAREMMCKMLARCFIWTNLIIYFILNWIIMCLLNLTHIDQTSLLFSTHAPVKVSTWCCIWPQQHEKLQLWSRVFTFICLSIFPTLPGPCTPSVPEVGWRSLLVPWQVFCAQRPSCRQAHRGAADCWGRWTWGWVTPQLGTELLPTLTFS